MHCFAFGLESKATLMMEQKTIIRGATPEDAWFRSGSRERLISLAQAEGEMP